MSRKIAVALSYPKGASAPFITAKGRGELAERIVEIARENAVHVEEDSLTAQILSLYEIGEYIPPETYEVVAGIFAFLMKVSKEA